jgi:hypothetical protein
MKRKKRLSPAKPVPRLAGVVGVGLDATDGHKRVTRTEEMVLIGGSAETHERMQETAIKFSEGLKAKGKSLPEVSVEEATNLLLDAIHRTGR